MKAARLLCQPLWVKLFLALLAFVGGSAQAAEKSSVWANSSGPNTDYGNPRFLFELPQDALVQIDLAAADADAANNPYLILVGLNLFPPVLAANDDRPGSLNSQLIMNLKAGKYLVYAGTSQPNQIGNRFTLRTSQGTLKYCFLAFPDANFGGTADPYCEGDTNSVSHNDTYSSIRIPEGMYVRAFTDVNRSGASRTYFHDVSWLGELLNDTLSSFSAGTFSTSDFDMIFASDSQFSWVHCEDLSTSELCAREKATFPGVSDEELSRFYNANQTAGIRKIKSFLGDWGLAGTIMNGDLTEFGDQGPDLDDYISYYEHGLDMNVYPGLGNHDYDNNVDDCAENGCASTMVWYLKDQVPTLNPAAFDYQQSDTYYSPPSYRRDHHGSLAYSWDVGNIHFVQLNNYMRYTRSWNGWNYSSARRDYFDVFASTDWLRNDLQWAKNRGMKIILNLHNYEAELSNPVFTQILSDFPVSAIFAGHRHEQQGQRFQFGPLADGKYVPVLLSGSAHFGTFLVGRFANNKLYVWTLAVDQFSGGALRVLYNGTYYNAASNTGDFFSIRSDKPRYYQYAYDLR